MTVLDRNSPWSVALHLGTALLLFATLILLFVREGRHPPAPVAAHVTGLAAIVWVGAILTMTTAAMTAKSGASLACYAWPSCDGSFLPALDDPLVRIHVIHRLGAAATGIGILLLAVAARVDGERRLAAAGALALLLVALQIGLGGVLIILEMPQWTQFAHQATGVLLYALLSFILWTAATSGRAREHGHGRLSHA